MKKCKPEMNVDEHIFQKSKHDLVFYLERDKENKIIFKDVIGMPKDAGILGYDVQIQKVDGKLCILQGEHKVF